MFITPKRKAKFFKNLGLTKLPYLPSILGLETGNICNLRCPLCPTGSNQEGLQKGFMKLSLFKIAVNQLIDSLVAINLFSWGEPLLNKDLIAMIEYIKIIKPSIKITTSTNLNFTDKNIIALLVKSGIDEIIVSCDGVSAQTYSQYRVGGDFNLVIENLKFLAQKNKEFKRSTLIVWNFLVFKHNEHEIEQARRMAESFGLNFRAGFIRTSMKDEILKDHRQSIEKDLDWIPNNPQYSAYDKEKKITKKIIKTCRKPWQEISINWDGKVFPCCAIYGDIYSLGNINEHNIKIIWNSQIYQQARKEIMGKCKTKDTICGICKSHGFTHM